MFYKLSVSLLSLFLISACAKATAVPATASNTPPPAATTKPAFTATAVPSSTPTLTATATATHTPTSPPTITPTYTVLRAKVLQRTNCRYGPGAPYLYKYGLLPDSNLEVIGRLDDANWVQLQAIGGDNPCWVKASLLEIKGDPFSVAPVYPHQAPLPVSPYYTPLGLKEISRNADQVTIKWYGQALRAGDEEYTGAPLYLIETWTCQDGQIKFTPYGLSVEILTVTDQNGCNEPSRARIYFSEKHGYAGPTHVEFP